ncbi:MAG: hypothetical protein ACRDN9_06280 [Streptosporangiaceae bacterium]
MTTAVALGADPDRVVEGHLRQGTGGGQPLRGGGEQRAVAAAEDVQPAAAVTASLTYPR